VLVAEEDPAPASSAARRATCLASAPRAAEEEEVPVRATNAARRATFPETAPRAAAWLEDVVIAVTPGAAASTAVARDTFPETAPRAALAAVEDVVDVAAAGVLLAADPVPASTAARMVTCLATAPLAARLFRRNNDNNAIKCMR
jgi:hypothetical protein